MGVGVATTQTGCRVFGRHLCGAGTLETPCPDGQLWLRALRPLKSCSPCQHMGESTLSGKERSLGIVTAGNPKDPLDTSVFTKIQQKTQSVAKKLLRFLLLSPLPPFLSSFFSSLPPSHSFFHSTNIYYTPTMCQAQFYVLQIFLKGTKTDTTLCLYPEHLSLWPSNYQLRKHASFL